MENDKTEFDLVTKWKPTGLLDCVVDEEKMAIALDIAANYIIDYGLIHKETECVIFPIIHKIFKDSIYLVDDEEIIDIVKQVDTEIKVITDLYGSCMTYLDAEAEFINIFYENYKNK